MKKGLKFFTPFNFYVPKAADLDEKGEELNENVSITLFKCNIFLRGAGVAQW